jgi:hypothetical protein
MGRCIVRAVLLCCVTACASTRAREVVVTVASDTCGGEFAEQAQPMAQHLAQSVYDLGTDDGPTTFGTDLRGPDDDACPIDLRYRVFVASPSPAYFRAIVGIGPVNRCSGEPTCLVMFDVAGER